MFLFTAVHFEMENYEECLKECNEAIQKGREVRADFKLIAKYNLHPTTNKR